MDLKMILLLGIGIALLYVGSGYSWNFANFNLSNIMSIAGDASVPVEERADVCDTYQPILETMAQNGVSVQETCTNAGGTWQCDSLHAGCVGMTTAPVCTDWLYVELVYECKVIKANGVCNSEGFLCAYS